MRTYCRPLLLVAFLITVAGCGGDDEESPATDTSSNAELCGPNASPHGLLGDNAHCHCDDGFKSVDGTCVPDNTSASMPNMPDMNLPDGGTGEDLQRALPIACWLSPGSQCDPRDGEGCDLDAGETCDLTLTASENINITCLPGPNTQPVDAACDPAAELFCAPGLHCIEPGVCKRFCCDDSSCDAGTRCQPFSADIGSLGLCESDAAPMCASAGGSCQRSSDCCSNDCHLGHCH